MDFVPVTLCCFAAFQAEIMIFESEFFGNGTFPAGATFIFGNTEHTFSGDTVEQLVIFPCAAVIGRTCRAGAHCPLFMG